MEGVEGLLRATLWLFDAGEIEHVLHHMFDFHKKFRLFSKGASLVGVALDSLIHNTPYLGVVFLRQRTPRVQIRGYGMPRETTMSVQYLSLLNLI